MFLARRRGLSVVIYQERSGALRHLHYVVQRHRGLEITLEGKLLVKEKMRQMGIGVFRDSIVETPFRTIVTMRYSGPRMASKAQ